MSIFKACDIRGVYGEDLTEREMERLGQALGTMAHAGEVILGGDVRESTPALKASAARGLTATGAKVVDIGIVPTPALYFAADRAKPAAAAMVTASHNPPEFNGLKFVIGEDVTGPDTVGELEKLASAGTFLEGKGRLETLDILSKYEDFVCHTATRWATHDRRLRVVVDAGNGCYSEIAPRVLARLGLDVAPLFCDIDGCFPNRDPNPAVGSLSALQAAVVDAAADMGVAFDGDGDRAVFVDELGRVVAGEHTACLLASDILRKEPGGKVVYDLKSTSALAERVADAGGVALMERSGYAFIKTRMRQERAVLGAEVSGHFFYGFLNGRDDGLLTTTYVAAIVAAANQSLGEMVAELPHYAITPDIRIPLDAGKVAETLAAIRAAATGRVIELDGVRIDYEDGWGLARASVTEPLITLRFEARTDKQLRAVVQRFLAPVPELAGEVAGKLAWA